MEASCLELALEGERACKAGDFLSGAAFFEHAVKVGTEDLKTLSAIYSQLGNAYFYLKDYAKALEYHKHDLTLARTIGDRIGEGKASGNLGNTLKILGQFDEALVCCQRHLDISQEQGDKVGEARALYNIGNVYHAKGKEALWTLPQEEPGHLPQEIQEALQKASEFYKRNLSLVKELADRAAQGRAYGNLGNAHYLMGNFSKAIVFHKQRLNIAKEFGDRAAERRAYSNLANAHIFLGSDLSIWAEHEVASVKTLHLSRQLKDQTVEAQTCYSLGNTYTLLEDYEKAVEYHLKHLAIAQELGDRVGEGRACWSLENAYVSLGKYEQALHFAEKHLEISQEIGDPAGEVTACTSIEQLRSALGSEQSGEGPDAFTAGLTGETFVLGKLSINSFFNFFQDQNGENLHLGDLEITGKDSLPFSASSHKYRQNPLLLESYSESPLEASDVQVQLSQLKTKRAPSSEDCFFDLLSKFQSNRMEDQRCPLEDSQRESDEAAATPVPALEEAQTQSMASPQTEELFDLIASSQSRRLDDQRASVGNLPGLRITPSNLGHLRMDGEAQEPGDEFFNMLMKCQSSRLDDQRCAPPHSIPRGPTVPDEDFFSLIQRVQAKRMDEQRVDLASGEDDQAKD
uniref:G protein signaling modulator 1 n=1 Tax=Naja naja TaxID=35670 RepID=A0A8C6X8P4_NAJNA